MKIITSTVKNPSFPAILGHPAEKCLFFDIETTGLSPLASSLYLIGCLHYNAADKHWEMTQYFADTYRDEEKLLLAFLSKLEQYCHLYHFNGKTFDIPYLLHKCEKYQIELTKHTNTILRDKSGLYSIDILAQIRPLKKLLGIQKANQTELERWLGLKREDTYSGGELIPIYSQYMQDQLLHPECAGKLEHLLLLHNHDDLEGLLSVSSIMNYRKLLEADTEIQKYLSVTSVQIHDRQTQEKAASACTENPNGLKSQQFLLLSFSHQGRLPKTISAAVDYPSAKEQRESPAACRLTLEEQSGYLEIPLCKAELKYFLPNPEDYYYLPAEDQAVHKSIGKFVEASHRQKATAATCYLKQSASFLPSLKAYKKTKEPADAEQTPLFFQQYRDRLCFYQLPDSTEPTEPFWKEYLIRELQAVID